MPKFYGYGRELEVSGQVFPIEKVNLHDIVTFADYSISYLVSGNQRIYHDNAKPHGKLSKWHSIPVIFVASRDGDFKDSVDAVFPTIPTDYNNGMMMSCYAHFGQHGDGVEDYFFNKETMYVCNFDQYKDLLVELLNYGDGTPEGSYQELNVIEKFNNTMLANWRSMRYTEICRINNFYKKEGI